jgi:hypothetical protein
MKPIRARTKTTDVADIIEIDDDDDDEWAVLVDNSDESDSYCTANISISLLQPQC